MINIYQIQWNCFKWTSSGRRYNGQPSTKPETVHETIKPDNQILQKKRRSWKIENSSEQFYCNNWTNIIWIKFLFCFCQSLKFLKFLLKSAYCSRILFVFFFRQIKIYCLGYITTVFLPMSKYSQVKVYAHFFFHFPRFCDVLLFMRGFKIMKNGPKLPLHTVDKSFYIE